MKKINIFVFTVIIFFIASIHSMEQVATEYNQQQPLIHLPTDTLNKIYFYINDNNTDLSYLIKSALAIKSTCTYFNTLLTAEQISQFCTPFDQEAKNNTLKKVLNRQFPSLILIYAKANPDEIPSEFSHTLLSKSLCSKDLLLTELLLQYKANPNTFVSFPSIPAFFYAYTKEVAQLLIEHGANINIKNNNNKPNILWHLIDECNFSQETRLDLFQFYLEKGVDPKALRSIDNACLFHQLVFSYNNLYINENLLKFGEILIKAAPTIINTINQQKETPLNSAINEKKCYKNKINLLKNDQYSSNLINSYEKNYKILKNFIIFLKNNDAKTAKELEEISAK